MSRECYPIRKGEDVKVSRNSHWCTVSLANVAALAEIKGSKVPDWVLEWNTYSFEKKVEVYGSKVCH